MISIIIPVYNENDSLRILHGEMTKVMQEQSIAFELLFIDDGSSDQSWSAIEELARNNASIRGIRLRKNFGKAAALSAGIRAARGQLLLTLDSDLQDDPREFPRFLKALEGPPALDVVSGWKKVRLDPWHKVFPSRVFNWMVSRLTGVHLHDHNCGMKAYRAEVFREIRLYGELHRFIPVLAAARGFKVGEITIQHRARRFGSSKYGFMRFIKGFLDLLTVKFLTGFGRRPQHLLGGLGLTSFVLGNVGLLYLAITWLVRLFEPGWSAPLHERPLLLYSVAALLMGGQMMSIGFLAELITSYQSRDEDGYSIAETISHTPETTHAPR